LVGFGEDTKGDVRCTGHVRKGLSLKDVMIYGLKWWASVDVIFARKYYSKQLWPASCHGLADTVGFHIAADYSRCPSVSQWWNAYKSDRAKKKSKSSGFAFRRKSRRRRSRSRRRKSRRRRSKSMR
jgi:hypothetical protein